MDIVHFDTNVYFMDKSKNVWQWTMNFWIWHKNIRIKREIHVRLLRRICYSLFLSIRGCAPRVWTGIANPYLYTIGWYIRWSEQYVLLVFCLIQKLSAQNSAVICRICVICMTLPQICQKTRKWFFYFPTQIGRGYICLGFNKIGIVI